MQKIMKDKLIPEDSIIQERFGKIDYFDVFQLRNVSYNTVDKILTKISNTPEWLKKLLNFRNCIIRFFGLKPCNTENDCVDKIYNVGDKGIYFKIIDRNEDEIVMEEKDTHLNFRTSVLVVPDNTIVFLSTIVQFNNLFGRVYFCLIKPIHVLIIKSTLRRLQ